jgi:hypothetical protein
MIIIRKLRKFNVTLNGNSFLVLKLVDIVPASYNNNNFIPPEFIC